MKLKVVCLLIAAVTVLTTAADARNRGDRVPCAVQAQSQPTPIVPDPPDRQGPDHPSDRAPDLLVLQDVKRLKLVAGRLERVHHAAAEAAVRLLL